MNITKKEFLQELKENEWEIFINYVYIENIKDYKTAQKLHKIKNTYFFEKDSNWFYRVQYHHSNKTQKEIFEAIEIVKDCKLLGKKICFDYMDLKKQKDIEKKHKELKQEQEKLKNIFKPNKTHFSFCSNEFSINKYTYRIDTTNKLYCMNGGTIFKYKDIKEITDK